MDRFQAFKNQVKLLSFATMLICAVVAIAGLLLSSLFDGVQLILVYAGLFLTVVLLAWSLSHVVANYVSEPMDFLWRAILHVTPGHSEYGAPNLDNNKVAHELVTGLVLQIYQLASSVPEPTKKHITNPLESITNDITHNLPLPIFAVNKDQNITFVNEAALKYVNLDSTDVLNKNLYAILDLMFSEDHTLDKWLADCRANKATAHQSWQRVRITLGDQRTVKQFDLAAAYSKENPLGIELLLTIFDQTERYQGEDNELDFIALTVHELRTPLTILRGYIEVFEDELADQLNREQAAFMRKMQASAQQLTAFVGNILNVARIQEGQLYLNLDRENWAGIIQTSIDSLSLAAQLNGITIEATVDPQVPEVAVDKISIVEVINNLIDNAIKYSGTGKVITIKAMLTKDGLVETTVSDDGLGIPAAVMPTLFEKFHRNHRNLAKIGGTGLGLYLCSSLVKAHGGNIWVKSKEGEGTTVGFTVQPYSMLAEKLKDSNNNEIVRNAHGWIKNHSLYRR